MNEEELLEKGQEYYEWFLETETKMKKLRGLQREAEWAIYDKEPKTEWYPDCLIEEQNND